MFKHVPLLVALWGFIFRLDARSNRRRRLVYAPLVDTLEGRRLLSVGSLPYDLEKSQVYPGPVAVAKPAVPKELTVSQTVPQLGGTTIVLASAKSAISRLSSGPSAHPQTTIETVVWGSKPSDFSQVNVSATHWRFHASGNFSKWATFHIIVSAEASLTGQIDTLSATVQYDKFISVLGSFVIDVDISLNSREVDEHQPYLPSLNSVDLQGIDASVTITENVSATKEYAVKGALVANVTSTHSHSDTSVDQIVASALASSKVEKGQGKYQAITTVGAHQIVANGIVSVDVPVALFELKTWASTSVTVNGSKVKASGNEFANASYTQKNGGLASQQTAITSKPSKKFVAQATATAPVVETGDFGHHTLRGIYNELSATRKPS